VASVTLAESTEASMDSGFLSANLRTVDVRVHVNRHYHVLCYYAIKCQEPVRWH